MWERTKMLLEQFSDDIYFVYFLIIVLMFL